MIKNNNLTVINPFVTRNFFRVLGSIRDKSKTLREQFEEFVEANQEKVDAINEMMMHGDYDLIKETYGYNMDYMKGKPVNEIKLPGFGGKRKTKVKDKDDLEDGFAETDRGWDDDNVPGEDSYFVGGEMGDGSSNVIESPNLEDEDAYYVKNLDKNSKNMQDLHYYCRVIYYQLLPEHTEKDEQTGEDIVYPNRRYDSECEYTMLNTEQCTTMDALFAFFDLPNIDLSTWDVSHVTNFEGMFYKSTFNNGSIRGWDVTSMTNNKNMFAYCPLNDRDVIANWSPKNGKRPILGDYVDDTIAKQRADIKVVRNRFGKTPEDLQAKIKARKEKMRIMQYENRNNYVMDSEQFINEGIKDTFKKVASKIKGWFQAIYVKTKEGISMLFDRNGERYNANSIDNVKEYIENFNIPGAYFNQVPEKSGTYDEIKKGSEEYNNFLEFCKIEKGSTGVSEARVTLASGSGIHDVKNVKDNVVKANIGATDINRQDFERMLRKQVFLTQKHPKRDKRTTVVWGAPGIGKTSIVKTVVEAMSSKNTSMATLVADCSQMTVDGFNLPTPAKQASIADIMANRKNAMEIAKANGLSDDDLKNIPLVQSSDAPKSWLPVYKPTGDPKKDRVLNAIANSYVTPIYNDNEEIDGYKVSEDGGVLFLDEFLRAPKQIFFAVCQIMNNYAFGEYVLGDKWQVVAASNRPSDDREVQKNFAEASAAGLSRMSHYNFVPSMDEWCAWAKDHCFDKVTLSFIRSNGADTPDSRFHNFDPDAQRTNNEPRMVSPRSWTNVINDFKDELEYIGKLDDPKHPDFSKIDKDEFYNIAKGWLPDNVALDYTEYYWNYNDNFKYTYDAIMKNPKMKVDSSDKNEGGKFTCNNAVDYLKGQVASRYDKKKWIPTDEFEKCMQFLCDNFKSTPNIIYENFFKYVVDVICRIPDEKADWYAPAFEVFMNAFPDLAEKYIELENSK